MYVGNLIPTEYPLGMNGMGEVHEPVKGYFYWALIGGLMGAAWLKGDPVKNFATGALITGAIPLVFQLAEKKG